MPTFALPVTLVANTNENVNDLNTDLNAITTALNTLDESNVANLAAAYTTWKTLLVSGTLPGSGIVTGAGTYLMPPGMNSGPPLLGAAATAQFAFYVDPADVAANARTTKMRIRWQLITGAVAPAMTITAGLYPVASYGGVSGIQMSVGTVGTVVAGSTAAFVSQAAVTSVLTLSTEFNMPAAGDYVLGFAASGAMAANSQATLRAHLQYRQV